MPTEHAQVAAAVEGALETSLGHAARRGIDVPWLTGRLSWVLYPKRLRHMEGYIFFKRVPSPLCPHLPGVTLEMKE